MGRRASCCVGCLGVACVSKVLAKGRGGPTVRAGRSATVGIVAINMNVHSPFRVRVMACDIPFYRCGAGLRLLLERDGPLDVRIATENSNCSPISEFSRKGLSIVRNRVQGFPSLCAQGMLGVDGRTEETMLKKGAQIPSSSPHSSRVTSKALTVQ